MDTLNHADQMRLANLINDNSDDAEIQKKMDQVVELTNSSRDQAAVALHDCHYDVEKAVDMILEGDHNTVENQWRSAGKKKNKNVSQSKAGNQAVGGYHGSNKHTGSNRNHQTSAASAGGHSNTGGSGGINAHHASVGGRDSHHQLAKGNNQSNAAAQSATSNQQINNSSGNNSSTSTNKQDASDSLKNIVGISSNLINTSDPANSSSATVAINKSSLQQHPQQQQQQQQRQQDQPTQQQNRQKATMHVGTRQHQRSTRIPESAVEMPNNEFQVSSLNVQFGELDLKDANVNASDSKGAFQDVLETTRLNRQSGLTNSQTSVPSQDNKGNRQSFQQQHQGKGGPRRPYYGTGDDRRFYNNSRGGRQATTGQRPYNQRTGQMSNNNASNNSRGVRTILNRGLQPNSGLTQSNSTQQSSGFPNSIDTWTNSTAEAATKQSTNPEASAAGVGGTLRVGQWSDVAGNEDWSEEEHWDAKVMETKVFTPSSKAVDIPSPASKSQSILTDASVPSQMNLKSKIPDSTRDVINSQTNTLNTATQPVQTQSSQKQLSHMNDIFDQSVAKAVLEQQTLAAMKPKTSIGMQYGKDTNEAKAALESQNLSSIKPKTNLNMNQYNKEASESLKSLVGISSSTSSSGTKGSVPSVPPGALPSMIQPQYIMGNAYQPAIFPYAYQAPDVHYPVAAPTAGRDQNFQSVYSPNDGNKFNRGADGDAPSIATTQTAPIASQTHNQAFVPNQIHAGYQLTYAMPGTFNMMPQNLYSAAPIFPHIPQPTNTGSANTVYQKNNPASYQHYSAYDQLNPLIQDYVKQQQQSYSGSSMQHQQPTSKASGVSNDIDATSGTSSYNMYGSVNKAPAQANKQTSYNDTKGYQQQQQFGFTHNAQQPSSITNYPLLQSHNLDNSDLNQQGGVQSQHQHSSGQRSGSQVNQSKYYPSWS